MTDRSSTYLQPPTTSTGQLALFGQVMPISGETEIGQLGMVLDTVTAYREPTVIHAADLGATSPFETMATFEYDAETETLTRMCDACGQPSSARHCESCRRIFEVNAFELF